MRFVPVLAQDEETGGFLGGLIDILKDFFWWLWCTVMNLLMDLMNTLLDVFFLFFPDLSNMTYFWEAMHQFFTYLRSIHNYFPLVYFITVYGMVQTLEIAMWVYKQTMDIAKEAA